MSKGAMEIPLSLIIFVIILIIVFAIILIWHLGGFEHFKTIMGNVTCETVSNTSQGRYGTC